MLIVWLIDLVYECIDNDKPQRERQKAEAHIETLDAYLDFKSEIPRGLSFEEQAVYDQLIEVVQRRRNAKKAPRNVLVITDLAKDYDDLVALTLLKEFHRLGLILLKGFVANLRPSHERARFGLGALQALGLGNIKIAEGSDGTDKETAVHEHEFIEAEKSFMAKPPVEFDAGQDLIRTICEQAALIKEEDKISLLLISSLRDINNFAQAEPRLLKSAVSNIILQGGYTLQYGHLIPDDKAANNSFDLPAAIVFHNFMQNNNIPSLVFNKIATFHVDISNQWFKDLEATGHVIGKHLRETQLAQERAYYTQAASGKPFAPFMTQEWYLKNKTTWWDHHAPGTPLPDNVEDVIPYLNKVVVYDALAAVGVAGDDVLEAFEILEVEEGKSELEKRHRVVGVETLQVEIAPKITAKEEYEVDTKKGQWRKIPNGERSTGVVRDFVKGFDDASMAAVIKALGRGSLLACTQGLMPGKV